ncbi:hypothetical protein [Brevundimonas denitrificans]|uniref:hypothetical protein n=1 Tax=Brevundimonas denitrificans TaxID=1443434 RepID=UPI00223B144B|nr:hypothetical protein [Brevundimonas denitrificans]
MRRFLVWSALALIIGLGLAGGGYWAYWNFYARFQPVVIQRDQAEIQRLLDEASWISPGGGGEPLYMVAWRDSAAAQRYEREEFPKLRGPGSSLASSSSPGRTVRGWPSPRPPSAPPWPRSG